MLGSFLLGCIAVGVLFVIIAIVNFRDYRHGVEYSFELTVEYMLYYNQHDAWPAPGDIHYEPVYSYLNSSTINGVRKDRFLAYGGVNIWSVLIDDDQQRVWVEVE